MIEIDLLPVDNPEGLGGRSGDAITARFSIPGRNHPVVVVVDAGYSRTGGEVVEHIQEIYDTNTVDLVISTHPDADHLNGLETVLSELSVTRLWVHQPRLHVPNVTAFSNLERLDALVAKADEDGVRLTEPFTGQQVLGWGDALTVLGPTLDYYEDLLQQHLAEATTSLAASAMTSTLSKRIERKALATLPAVETLTDNVETGVRNDGSVITLLQVDGQRVLLTGDAGIPALTAAAEEYERRVGDFAASPLDLLQVPHHGSRRNVGPTILNRLLGHPGDPARPTQAVISASQADEKHPSPKVTNALLRRGIQSYVNAGKTMTWQHDVPRRFGMVDVVPEPPRDED